MQLKQLMNKIENQNPNKISIVAFKGFPYSLLKSLDNKFFDEFSKMIINDIDINAVKERLLPQLISKATGSGKAYWMTYEELLLSYQLVNLNFNVIVVNNNLYNKKYPFDYTVRDIERVYKDFYLNIEQEIDNEKKAELDLISTFYGGVLYSEKMDQYYVSYNDTDIENVTISNFYEVGDHQVSMIEPTDTTDETVVIELSDDETVFLDVIQQLMTNQEKPKELRIVTMTKLAELPNNYLERIEILQALLKESTKIYFTKKTIESAVIKNLSKYTDILKEYWGYPSFRDLTMYRDVRDPKKQLIQISQAQIINDIVEQTALALNNKPYRDVYITSATGSGKSVMFQVPSLYLSREFSAENPLTLIISPLIGLMNDQVDSMRAKGIDTARTIHSNVAPFERDKIINEISNGQVNMLYLSPETLQSRSDIKLLIGERRIGLVIIDEAHIVTTWGKSFRADYWYLGIYLQKLRKKYRFPIVTFTATAIYGGKEDMYLETRDSLNMINPISYFGNVKREDIFMCISSSDEKTEDYSREYLRTKQQLTLIHLEKAFRNKQKSLVYFPTVKLLNQFNSFLKLNHSEIAAVTGIYNGQLQKEEKDEVLTSFKNGELRFVLATKAFGMGIDIPDITNVYHYAPSGSVTDYIQEIGRVAREKDQVEFGFAWLDFLSRDFTEVKRLHGMGKITRDHLLAVMNKIINLYHEKGNNRNLVVSAVDFKHIFREDDHNDDRNLDNKLKTALLLIEKDFESPNNIGFPPFAARPRSVFGRDSILVNQETEQKLLSSPIRPYLKLKHYLENSHYKAIYTVNLSELWEDHYKNISFPQFKFMLFTPEERTKLKHSNYFDDFVYATGISITKLEDKRINDVLSQLSLYVRFFEEFVADKKRTGSYFSLNELGYYLQDKMHLSDIFKARSVAQAFINTCFEYQKVKNYKFIKERPSLKGSMYVLNNNYDIFINFIKDTFNNFFRNKTTYFENKVEFIKYYHRTKKNNYFDLDIIPLGLAEAIGLINYSVENGNNPQIYIRINAISPMESAIKKNKFYKNRLLNDVHMKHYISVEMLTYLFKYQAEGNTQSEKVKNYTKFFWETIEDYFLGTVPAPVEEALAKQSFNNNSAD